MAAMSDEELKAKTDEFKERYNMVESLIHCYMWMKAAHEKRTKTRA